MGTINTVPYSLAEQLRSGKVVRAIWSSMPDIGVLSALAASKFDGIVIDMQHGAHSVDTVYAGVEDAALFRSTDGGHTWHELAGLLVTVASFGLWTVTLGRTMRPR